MNKLRRGSATLVSLIAILSGSLSAKPVLKLSVIEKIKKLEASTNGRIGVYAINTKNNSIIKYRANEIFPTGCTSKIVGVGAVLKKSMADPNLLSHKKKYTTNQLDSWSPITKNFTNKGMTIKELCAAAISYSDNTAMNLLLEHINGIQGMNDFAHSIDEKVFRQDNNWPKEAYSGGINNKKDSSSPKSMVNTLRKLTLEDKLGKFQRELLIRWLINTKTGSNRIRKGIPNNWVVGNKTGTGAAYGTTNDIAIVWPPDNNPILIGIYYTTNYLNEKNQEDVLSNTTKFLIEEFLNN